MDEIRQQLIAALRGGQAYDSMGQILAEIPVKNRYERPDGVERSAWQILDHMRRTLEDLLAYSTNVKGDYQELKWPDDYWPASVGQADDWDCSLTGLEEAQRKMESLILKEDLTKPFPESHRTTCSVRRSLPSNTPPTTQANSSSWRGG